MGAPGQWRASPCRIDSGTVVRGLIGRPPLADDLRIRHERGGIGKRVGPEPRAVSLSEKALTPTPSPRERRPEGRVRGSGFENGNSPSPEPLGVAAQPGGLGKLVTSR